MTLEPGRRRAIALATASVAMLLISFNATATNIAFPALQDDFATYGLASLSWIISGFNITQTMMMLVGGRLADREGRRKIFLIGIAVLTVGSLLTGVAPTVPLLVAARVLQAVGAALVLPTSLAAVLPDFPVERRASVVSVWAGVGVFGATAAPSLGAVIVELSGWRAIFLSIVPICVLAFMFGRATMTESRPEVRPARLDLVGAVQGTAALGLLALGVVQGPRWGWTSAATLGALIGALILGPAFVHRCRTQSEPLLNLTLFHHRTFTIATLASAFLAVSTTATWFLYPLFMSRVWGYSTWEIGLAITPGPAVMVFVNLWAGRQADRRGYRRLMTVGASLACLGTLWLALFFREGNGYVLGFLPATLTIGIGMGLSMGPMNSAALRDVSEEILGEANAAYNTVRSFGSALGVAFVVAVLGDQGGSGLPDAFVQAFFLSLVLMLVAPLLIGFAYPRDHCGSKDVSAVS
jgi:EmrB/QacA subfamily drug resistance transporter